MTFEYILQQQAAAHVQNDCRTCASFFSKHVLGMCAVYAGGWGMTFEVSILNQVCLVALRLLPSCRTDIELDINPLPTFVTKIPGLKNITTITVRGV